MLVIKGNSEKKKVVDVIRKFFKSEYEPSTLKVETKRVDHYLNYNDATEFCEKQYNWSSNSVSALQARNTMITNCINRNTGRTLHDYVTTGHGYKGFEVKDKNPNILFAYEIRTQDNQTAYDYSIKLFDDGKNLLLYRTSSAHCVTYQWLTVHLQEVLDKNNIKTLKARSYIF